MTNNKEEIKNMPYPLPEGWKWVRIKDLINEIKSGFSCPKKYETAKENGIPHLRPNNVGYFNELDLTKVVYVPFEKFKEDEYKLKAGDILFNNTNSKELVGRSIVLKNDFKGGYSNHLTRIRVEKNIVVPEFLSWCFNFYWLKGFFLRISNKWIGQAGVNSKMLKEILIPLPFKNGKPDLEKQKQIVERIETIFKEIDKAIALRQKALEDTKKFFESVLNKIFKEAEEDRENWKWMKLEEIAEKIKAGGTPSRKEKKYWKNGTIPWVKISDIHENDFLVKDTEEKITEEGLKNSSAKLFKKGTLLFSIFASIGKVGILDIDATTNQAIVGIELKEKIDTRFMAYLLKYFSQDLISISRGNAQNNINQTILKNLLIPIPYKNNQPDLEKQKEIAEYLDNLHSKIKQLEELQKLQVEKFKQLKESILNKAFRGELV